MILKKIMTSFVIIVSLVGLVGLSAVSLSSSAFAAPDCNQPSTLTAKEQAKCGSDSVNNGGNGDLATFIKNVINILLFIIGMTAVIFIVIAGFRFVTSNGEAATVSQAKNTIIYAVLGLVVAVAAYAIVNFVISNIA